MSDHSNKLVLLLFVCMEEIAYKLLQFIENRIQSNGNN
jgi:hypothetical protein